MDLHAVCRVLDGGLQLEPRAGLGAIRDGPSLDSLHVSGSGDPRLGDEGNNFRFLV